jgi:hypothetical protein
MCPNCKLSCLLGRAPSNDRAMHMVCTHMGQPKLATLPSKESGSLTISERARDRFPGRIAMFLFFFTFFLVVCLDLYLIIKNVRFPFVNHFFRPIYPLTKIHITLNTIRVKKKRFSFNTSIAKTFVPSYVLCWAVRALRPVLGRQ